MKWISDFQQTPKKIHILSKIQTFKNSPEDIDIDKLLSLKNQVI